MDVVVNSLAMNTDCILKGSDCLQVLLVSAICESDFQLF